MLATVISVDPADEVDVGDVAHEQRVDLLEEALRLIPQREKAQRIRVYSELAVALYWSPDSRRCMAVAETAAALARKLGQPAPLAHALYARCIAQ